MGALLVFISAVGFSAKAVLVKLAYRYGVDPATLLFFRMVFSLPFFLFPLMYMGIGKKWLSAVLLGFVGFFLASFFDFLGLKYISAGLERMVLMLYPTIVVLLSALFFRQRLSGRQLAALGLCYLGIVFAFLHDLAGSERNLWLGSWLVFLSALSYAVYLVGSGRVIAEIGAQRFTAIAMTAASAASIAQFFLFEPVSALSAPQNVYWLAAAMAVFSTVLPAFLLAEGLKRVGAAKAAIINSAGPPMTIFLAHFLLAESVSLLQLLGLVLVLAGVLSISLGKS